MDEVSTSVKIPLLLQADKLEALNKKLVEQTGCFAFIKTEQVLLAAKPKSNRDAFANYIIGLYVVFHDYGCRIITGFMCNNEYVPNGIQYNFKNVKDIISRIELLRHGIAHGSVSIVDHNALQACLFRYYMKDSGIEYSDVEQWPDFVNALTEKDWRQGIENLAKEADDVYHYIDEWGCKYAEGRYGDRIRRDFGKNPCFYESYDKRVCERILLENGIKKEKIDHYYLSEKEEFLRNWQEEIKSCFLDENISDPTTLLNKLKRKIQETVNPPAPSSVTTGEKYGYGLS